MKRVICTSLGAYSLPNKQLRPQLFLECWHRQECAFETCTAEHAKRLRKQIGAYSLKVFAPAPNSGVFVLPMTIAPLSSRTSTKASFAAAMRSLYMRLPCNMHKTSPLISVGWHHDQLHPLCSFTSMILTSVNGSPFTAVKSFTSTGKPAARKMCAAMRSPDWQVPLKLHASQHCCITYRAGIQANWPWQTSASLQRSVWLAQNTVWEWRSVPHL